MNNSFLDFDLLAKFDPDSLEIKGPSLYSEFVWDCRKRRLMAQRANLDWVVMRNRVSSVEMRNKRRVAHGCGAALVARRLPRRARVFRPRDFPRAVSPSD